MIDFSFEYLKLLLTEQRQVFQALPKSTQRQLLPEIDSGFKSQSIQIISGLRRVGKSTLMSQWAKNRQGWHYVNFEDERLLGFEASQFERLDQQLVAIDSKATIYLFDEIQNVKHWELFVRRLQDQGKRILITGSNASLLSQELGTKLTGRYLGHQLFPFTLGEYLTYQQLKPNLPKTMTDLAKLNHGLMNYLVDGGVPLFLKSNDDKVVSQLLQDIIYRDIVARYKVDAIKSLTDLVGLLLTTPGQLISYSKLKTVLGLGSTNTVINFVEYINTSWLIGVVPQFAYSRKTQLVNQKKIYPIDPRFVSLMQVGKQQNSGRLLELLVYWTLKRRYHDVYYFRTDNNLEVDFYIPEENRLIQVTEDLYNPQIIERETRALNQAASELRHTPEKLILCLTPPPTKLEGIEIRPIAEWLLT